MKLILNRKDLFDGKYETRQVGNPSDAKIEENAPVRKKMKI